VLVSSEKEQFDTSQQRTSVLEISFVSSTGCIR